MVSSMMSGHCAPGRGHQAEHEKCGMDGCRCSCHQRIKVGRTYLFDPFPGASEVLWPGPEGVLAEVLATGVRADIGGLGLIRHDGVRVRFPDGTEQVVAPLGLKGKGS